MNYRLLKVGERIREGDEFQLSTGHWVLSSNAAGWVDSGYGRNRYRRKLATQRPIKAVKNSFPVVTISRRDAKKLFKLAKDHAKNERDWAWAGDDETHADEWDALLKALRKLETETLNSK